jgi:hypothetical protein
MTILDITPAGAYANALEAAKARERREAAPYVSTAPAVAALPPRLPFAARLRRTLARAAKRNAAPCAAAGLRSRTA